MSESILLIDDEETLRESLGRLLVREGYTVTTTGSAEDALGLVGKNSYELIITDIFLPGMDGIELLRRVKGLAPEQLVVIITAYASLETAVEALRAGAYDYIMKPVIHEEIKTLVRHAMRQRALQVENTILKKQIERDYDFSHIIGESKKLIAVQDEIAKIADTKSNVLLVGETGTGKELFARAIHFNSARKEKPFFPINCSAIPENLMESELFGHLKGAFTGAVSSKKGLFVEANGGTVFLDEIGEMDASMQAKLLRVLEDQQVRPVGGTQPAKVDLRFISATNKDLLSASARGEFREDLFYRINTISVKLPPLRERGADVELLAGHFLAKFSAELGKPVKDISKEAARMLIAYPWPGNVRELKNIIERAVLITGSGTVLPEHLPEGIRQSTSMAEKAVDEALSIDGYVRALITRYQDTCSEQKIADMLGITRKSLWEKRRKWGLKRPSR